MTVACEALRDWSRGCTRKAWLDCKNGTDGFVTMQRTPLPDTVSATVYVTMGLDECKAECSRNCSCTAYASADARDGDRGCIIWSTKLSDILIYSGGGQDLYVRLPAVDTAKGSRPSQSHKCRKATLAVALCVVLGALLLVTTVCYAWKKNKWHRGSAREDDIEMELPQFDLETVGAATNNFSNDNKLGEGGFGPIYKGQEIAVKRLSKSSVQGIVELKTETILVTKLQHRNLVRLLGYCIQEDEMLLIYEYMLNRSLDAFLLAWTLWEEGNGLQPADASIRRSFSAAEVLRCIKVGLLCVQEDPEDRPTISTAILMLSSDHAFLPEPRQPAFLVRMEHLQESSPSVSHNINDVTITVPSARQPLFYICQHSCGSLVIFFFFFFLPPFYLLN